MPRCKITVIKKMVNQELADEYCVNTVSSCSCFKEDQEFMCGLEKPPGFCDWAWRDIHPFVVALLTGGNFSHGLFDGWMRDDRTIIACCTDGIRPVIFRIEKIDE
jgi:uncharacterized repeat protein (TIGR04076 family)